MNEIKVRFGLSHTADQRSATGVRLAPPRAAEQARPFECSWQAERPQSNTGMNLVANVQSDTRRHLAIVSAITSSSWDRYDKVSGFEWNGGEPDTPIELDDLSYDPASPDVSVDVVTYGLTVLTDRFEPGLLRITGTATNVFVEGEEEAAFRVWPGGLP